MSIAELLRQVAEQIVGEIEIDVTYLVSARAGTTLTGSARTLEAALAEFISAVLDEQADTENASADHMVERAGLPIAPGITARPVEEGSAAQPADTSKRRGAYHSREQLSAERIRRIYELRDAGKLTVREIAAEVGCSKTSIETYLRTRRRVAAQGASTAGAG
jgi:hypothetical protein